MLLIERFAFILLMKLLLVLLFVARARQNPGMLSVKSLEKRLVSSHQQKSNTTEVREELSYNDQRAAQQIIQFDSGIVLFVGDSSVTTAEQDSKEVLL